MQLGPGQLPTNQTAGVSPTMACTTSSPTNTSLVVTHDAPSVGTLSSWDLDYRVVGASTWIRKQSGITDSSIVVNGLSANTDYEFLPTPHVIIDGVGVVGTGTTTSAPTSYDLTEVANSSLLHTLNPVSTYLASQSMSGDTMTIAVSVVNTTGQTQTKMGIGIVSGAYVSGIFKARVKLGSDVRNPAGPWSDLDWSGSSTTRVTQVPISWWSSGDLPLQGRYVHSSLVDLPGPVASGERATIWLVMSTTVSGEVIPDCEGLAVGAGDVVVDLASIGSGDGIAGSIASWAYTGHPIGLASVVWGRTAAYTQVPLYCCGDSTTAMFPGLGPDRRGWQYHANALARSSGKRIRYSGLGISSDQMDSIASRAIDAIPLIAASGGALAIQFMSWNSRYDYLGALDNLASVEAACDAAGVKMIPYVTAPPGSDQPWQSDPWAYPQISDHLSAYASAKATMLAAYPYAIDMSVPITTGADYNRSDSSDDVHALLGTAETPVGQYKMAQTLDASIVASMNAVGIDISPV